MRKFGDFSTAKSNLRIGMACFCGYKKTYMLPWKFLFFSIAVYIFEEFITVLEITGAITVSKLVFPVLEMIIITSFTYMV